MIKYSYKIFMFNREDINDNNVLEALQDKGWEVCGPISPPHKEEWCVIKNIRVPMRKKI